MADKYDAAHIESFYDDYGSAEWERLGPDSTALHQVNFHIHKSYLERFIQPGQHVLEAGAGAGRFTLELARLGARLTVGDISSTQLELNRKVCAEHGLAERVLAFEQLDITDLSRYPAEQFDTVVCYGGPLSYVFDQAEKTLLEMLRVLKPGGLLLLSVMSLVGSTQHLLPTILEQLSPERVGEILRTGDLDQEGAHRLRMYRWKTLSALLEKVGGTILAASAAGHLCVGNDATVARIRADPHRWASFLSWELDLCAEPGAIDGGTHILAVVQK